MVGGQVEAEREMLILDQIARVGFGGGAEGKVLVCGGEQRFADYTRAGEIWNGTHPEDGSELRVSADIPEGFPWPDLDEEPQLSSPGIDPDMLKYFAKKMGSDAADELHARTSDDAASGKL